MQTIYMIRRWDEKLCRKGQDNELFECGLDDAALVDVIFDTEDNGEDGQSIVIEQVIPRKNIVLDGGTGPCVMYRAGQDCIDYLPPAIVQDMRETIVIPVEQETALECGWTL